MEKKTLIIVVVIANSHENKNESALNSLPSNLGHWVKP
jgi:hypothetical protein